MKPHKAGLRIRWLDEASSGLMTPYQATRLMTPYQATRTYICIYIYTYVYIAIAQAMSGLIGGHQAGHPVQLVV